MIDSIAECHTDDVDDDGGDADLDWCVDLRPLLCAMSTADLWAAAVDGKVDRDMRAWRLGLECWTRLADIPEVAGAFEPLEPLESLELAPMSEAAVTPPAVEITSLPMLDRSPPVTSPVEWAGASRGGAAVAPPELLPWREVIAGRLRGALIGARWIAAGSAIAGAFIGLSLVSTAPPEPREVAQVAQASTGVTVARAVGIAARPPASSRLGAASRVAGPSRAEPGQRRLRAGRGQARAR